MHPTADFDARFFDPLNRRIVREPRDARLRASARRRERGAARRDLPRGRVLADQVDPRELDGALRALGRLVLAAS